MLGSERLFKIFVCFRSAHGALCPCYNYCFRNGFALEPMSSIARVKPKNSNDAVNNMLAEDHSMPNNNVSSIGGLPQHSHISLDI